MLAISSYPKFPQHFVGRAREGELATRRNYTYSSRIARIPQDVLRKPLVHDPRILTGVHMTPESDGTQKAIELGLKKGSKDIDKTWYLSLRSKGARELAHRVHTQGVYIQVESPRFD